MAHHTPRSDDHKRQPGFWLSFLTSLSAHVGIVVLGILLVGAIPKLVNSHPEPPVDLNAPVIDSAHDSADSLHLGAAENKYLEPQQDLFQVPDTRGISNAPVNGTQVSILKSGDTGEESVIAVGPGAGSYLPGHNTGRPGGNSDDPAPAPFGIPQTGGGQHPGLFVDTPPGGRGVHTIVFVCDATGSMMPKFDTLREQMQKSIRQLSPAQYFSIIFFQSPNENHAAEFVSMSSEVLRATPEVKKQGDDLIDNTTARGSTNPIPAFKAALSMHPDLIWFLVDPDDFENKPQLLQIAREMNADHKTRINTIAFFDRNDNDEAFLKQMAKENGGSYKLVEEKDLNP